MDIKGHAAVVTGGASGLGAATAIELARAGARVACLDLDLDGARAVADKIGGAAVRCDVTDAEEAAAALTEARNRHGAALMLRIHADGSGSSSDRGASTLYPAFHRGWTSDVYGPSLHAAHAIQRSLVAATGARDLGLSRRGDLTGFNWADVPVVLVETGFMTNPAERRLLKSAGYQARVARGLAAGVAEFTPPA